MERLVSGYCGLSVGSGVNPAQYRRARLATWLLLAPIFLQRVFIGGEGDSYADYPGFSLQLVGYFCHFSLVAMAATGLSGRTRVNQGLLLGGAVLMALSILQVHLASQASGLPLAELLLPLMRGWLWLLAIIGYLFYFHDDDVFARTFFDFCRVTCVLLIACLIFYAVTNIAFGVHIARGYPRVHAFFSEPSALAVVLPAFLVYSVRQRKKLDIFLSSLGVALSGSVIVYLTLVLALLTYTLRSCGRKGVSNAVIIAYASLVVITPLALTAENSAAISTIAQNAVAAFSIETEDTMAFEVFVGRILIALTALGDVIANYSNDNAGGSLARLIGSIITLDELKSAGVQFLGFGLNVYGYISVAKYGDIFDFGFQPFLMSSFGVLGSTAAVALLVSRVIGMADNVSGSGIIMFSGLFATFANSAGGLHAYAIPLLGLLLAIFMPKPHKVRRLSGSNVLTSAAGMSRRS